METEVRRITVIRGRDIKGRVTQESPFINDDSKVLNKKFVSPSLVGCGGVGVKHNLG